MSGAAAFFDLDRTLIDANSGFLWAQYERARGGIGTLQFVRVAFWAAMYHFALIDMEKAYTEATLHYRGESSATLQQRTRQWFARDIATRLQRGAATSLDWHRAKGHPLVLLTNTSCYEAQVATETWKLDDWIANLFDEDEQGKLLGTYQRPLCYGQGKVTRAEAWAQDNDVDLDMSFFYSDSYSDLPMLERVGNPRVVQPDPRLQRVAKQRGWRVEAWG